MAGLPGYYIPGIGVAPLGQPASLVAAAATTPRGGQDAPGFFGFAQQCKGFPSYSFLPTTSALSGSDRLTSAAAAASYFPDYGSASAANQVIATLMARQGDSQMALGAPTLLTDQYLSQRGVHGMSASAVGRNVLSAGDQGADFVVTTGGGVLPVMNSYVSSTSRAGPHLGATVDLFSPNSDTPVNYIQTGSPQPSGFAMNIGGALIQTFQNGFH